MSETSHQTGLNAEKLCRLVLRLKLYRILASRYKTAQGEVDIIAARGFTIIAVEVKARPNTDSAAESISGQQQLRITNALQHFVMKNPRYRNANLRFDVMLAAPRRWPMHVKNAWRAG